MNTTGRMGAARRCVDEYLSESIRVSTVWLWGIGDDGIRNDRRRLSAEAALRTLVEGVRGRTSEVDAWLHAAGDAGILVRVAHGVPVPADGLRQGGWHPLT